jgi:predicted HNH restriction endonuclease
MIMTEHLLTLLNNVSQAWLLLAYGEEQNYIGHSGYQDIVEEVYRYDNSVPNYRRISDGDLVLVRDQERLLGMAKIIRIEKETGVKERKRCPFCNTGDLYKRRTKTPIFKCKKGHEFDDPIYKKECCENYSAYFGNTFINVYPEIVIDRHQLAQMCPKYNQQLSMQFIDLNKIKSNLLPKTCQIKHQENLVVSQINYPDKVNENFHEGKVKEVKVNIYERNLKAREICIKKHGLTCSICGFSFRKKYGEIGENFIHVHHLKPLSEIRTDYQLDPIKDLRPVCPNCHEMLHRKEPAYSLEELINIIKENTSDD